MNSNRTTLIVAFILAMPGLILRVSGNHYGVILDTTAYGVSIVSSAFLLSWAAEAAQVDITQGLAIAFVALIAVLPEYAVDMTFAWKAGQDPVYAQYAVANMTGGNRLLIGAAWPMLVFLVWARTRARSLHLEPSHAIEVLVLAAVSIYAITIPLKGSIELYDAAILFAGFVVYIWLIARVPSEEPELVGPARLIGTLPRAQRRGSLLFMFLWAAGAILVSAEPFAEGLIHSGTELGIDEFVLVQWVAPFASESPEFLIAGILAWRGRASVGMGALLSSKVNQWTLLIGGLPIAYALSRGSFGGLVMDDRQREEVFLTAAQTFFAIAVVLSLSLSLKEAFALFALFAVTFVIPSTEVRMATGVLYLVLTVILIVVQRHEVPVLWRKARSTLAESNAAAHGDHPSRSG